MPPMVRRVRKVSLPTFVDLVKDRSRKYIAGHVVTNEDLTIHREFLDKFCQAPVELSGGIASGGEVPLLCLLPRSKKVIVIDHSRRALAVFWLKCMMLRDHGPDVVNTMFHSYGKLHDEARKLWDKIPTVLTDNLKAPYSSFSGSMSPDKNFHEFIPDYELANIEKKWQSVPTATLSEVQKRLKHITLLYGDVRKDLPVYGKFNILYTSNATEHVDRDGATPRLDEYKQLLADDGLLITTKFSVGKGGQLDCNGLKQLDSRRPMSGSWAYYIHQAVKESDSETKRDDVVVGSPQP